MNAILTEVDKLDIEARVAAAMWRLKMQESCSDSLILDNLELAFARGYIEGVGKERGYFGNQ